MSWRSAGGAPPRDGRPAALSTAFARVQQEERQERALVAAGERECDGVAEHLERTEDPRVSSICDSCNRLLDLVEEAAGRRLAHRETVVTGPLPPPPTVAAWLPRASPQLSPDWPRRSCSSSPPRRPGEQIPAAAPPFEHEEYEEEGYAAAKARRQEPDAIEAAFALESYRPGSIATLRVWTRIEGTTISIHRVGPESKPTVGSKTMEGVTMAAARPVYGAAPQIPIGRDWPSGLYFARLQAPGKVGFAPFVVRPRSLGEHSVAVVLPTRTWQAYNFRDDDADGDGDTWYATRGSAAALGRPYLNRGVPPHFRKYDLPFLRWLHQTGRGHDLLSQASSTPQTAPGWRGLRPDRVPWPPRVRDGAGVRRDQGLPRPRREHDVPLGE